MDREGNRPSLNVTSQHASEEGRCVQTQMQTHMRMRRGDKGVECEVLTNAQQESFKQKGTRISGFEEPLEGLLGFPFPLGNGLQHP